MLTFTTAGATTVAELTTPEADARCCWPVGMKVLIPVLLTFIELPKRSTTTVSVEPKIALLPQWGLVWKKQDVELVPQYPTR
jgi:hypothetical protein